MSKKKNPAQVDLDAQEVTEQCVRLLREPNAKPPVRHKTLLNAVEDVVPAAVLQSIAAGDDRQIESLNRAIVKLLHENSRVRRAFLTIDSNQRRRGRPTVFISYRRSCSEDFVGRLADRIKSTGRCQVVYDRISLRAGSFPAQLGSLVRASDALLLIVEDQTLEHIDDPANFIRRELYTAIEAAVPIIPVLVDTEDFDIDWPHDIRSIAEQQVLYFKRAYYDSSVSKLISGIGVVARR